MMTNESDSSVIPVRRQPLDSGGTCTKCDKKCDKDYMRCFGCDELFHVRNCGSSRKQVTQTFYEQWDSMNNNYPNIQYVCDACKVDKQTKKDIIVSNRICVLEDELKGIKEVMMDKFQGLEDTMKKMVETKVEPAAAVINKDYPPLPSFSDKVSKGVIVIKKKKNGPSADMDAIYRAAVDTNTAVSKAYNNNAGDTVVVLEDEKSKESMLPLLNEAMDNDSFTVVTPKSRLPTITIIDIPSNYSKKDLLARVKNQNTSKFASAGIELDEGNFNIIYTRAQVKNNNLYKAVVRVGENVRRAIDKANNKLNIGLTSCTVFDDLFVKRCNRCQGLHHFRDKCPEENKVICGNCAGEHETRSCVSDTIKCYNCTQAKYPDTNHKSSYYKCRVYVEAQKKLEETINYYSTRTKN